MEKSREQIEEKPGLAQSEHGEHNKQKSHEFGISSSVLVLEAK